MSDDLDKQVDELVYSETPKDLRPDLSYYGIDEVDRGICLDTYENRSILRSNRLSWQPVYNADGDHTGNIEVLSTEMQALRSTKTLEALKIILTDDRDLNSDYLTEEALLIEEQSDTLIPLWVTAATRTWIRVREARAKGEKALPILIGPPARCRIIKSDGVRCAKWYSGRATDDYMCPVHLGSRSPNAQTGAVAQARRRAYQAAPTALAIIEQLMESAESEQVKLKAAESILDRAGIRGGVEIDAKVEVSERPADDIIRERLARLIPQALQQEQLQPQEEILEVEATVVETVETVDMKESD